MATMFNTSHMLDELKNIGITVPYLNEDTICDYYNQYIIRRPPYIEREEFVSIVLHPMNSKFVDEYFWRR